MLPDTGTYTIYVKAGSTGPYSFKLWAVTDDAFTLNSGDTVNDGFINATPTDGAGNIETPGTTDTYTFAGVAGQIIYLQRLAGNWPLYWRLSDPDGNTLGETELGPPTI